MPMSSFPALARFFGGSAVRVALRSSALGLILTFFWIGVVTPEILYNLRELAFSLTTARAGPGGVYLLAALGLGLASQAVHRFRIGLHGWMRSLPAGSLTTRRAIWLGLLWAELPLAVVYAGAMLATVTVYGGTLA